MNSVRSLMILISRIPPAMLVAIIVGVAGVTAMLVSGEMERNRVEFEKSKANLEAQRNAMGTVVVASRDIPEGKPIASDFLEEKKIPAGKIPTDAITSSAMAAGRLSKYGISQGQVVSQHDLMPIGISLEFESKLKPGMRALTFAVDTNSGVAGFIKPESRVDIMSMVGSGAETKVAPILSDVEVIAVGQMYQREPGASQAIPANSVTVAINPEDAQKLVKGVAASKLYLSLRSQNDHAPLLTVDVTTLFPKKIADGGEEIAQTAMIPPPPTSAIPQGDLPEQNFGAGNPMEIPQPPPPPNHEIEMWNGGSKQLIEVPNHR